MNLRSNRVSVCAADGHVRVWRGRSRSRSRPEGVRVGGSGGRAVAVSSAAQAAVHPERGARPIAASVTTRPSTRTFSTARTAKNDQSCATCHKNVVGALQRQVGRRDRRPDAVAQDAQGARRQRHLSDVPREGRARELARRPARPARHRLHLLSQHPQLQVGEGAAEDRAATPKPASPATSRFARNTSARRITRCAKARWTARAATTRTTRRSPR